MTAVLAPFIILSVKKGIFKRRNACFERNYLPGLQQFLDQRTPLLEKQFSAPQIK